MHNNIFLFTIPLINPKTTFQIMCFCFAFGALSSPSIVCALVSADSIFTVDKKFLPLLRDFNTKYFSNDDSKRALAVFHFIQCDAMRQYDLYIVGGFSFVARFMHNQLLELYLFFFLPSLLSCELVCAIFLFEMF